MNNHLVDPPAEIGEGTFAMEHVECYGCKEQIIRGARICKHCGSHQSFLKDNIAQIGLLTTVVLVALSFLQYGEARNQTAKADETADAAELAAGRAQEANVQAIKAQEFASQTASEVESTAESISKLELEMMALVIDLNHRVLRPLEEERALVDNKLRTTAWRSPPHAEIERLNFLSRQIGPLTGR